MTSTQPSYEKKTCETCAFWTSRRPNEQQRIELEAEYHRLDVESQAKREERDTLQDTLRAKYRAEGWQRPRTVWDAIDEPIVTNLSGYNDDVWHLPEVQKLHRELGAIQEKKYALRDKLRPRDSGECTWSFACSLVVKSRARGPRQKRAQ